jgi:hypothetical protein
MDNVNLPEPVRSNLLRQLSNNELLNFCNTNRQNRRLCILDWELWSGKINKECPEYTLVNEEINPGNAYDKYIECQNRRKLINKIADRNNLSYMPEAMRNSITRNMIIHYAIKNNDLKLLSLNISDQESSGILNSIIREGNVPLAQWFYNHYNLTMEEMERRGNPKILLMSFAITSGSSEMMQWVQKHYILNKQDILTPRLGFYGNVTLFQHACEKDKQLARWLYLYFQLPLTQQQLEQCGLLYI